MEKTYLMDLQILQILTGSEGNKLDDEYNNYLKNIVDIIRTKLHSIYRKKGIPEPTYKEFSDLIIFNFLAGFAPLKNRTYIREKFLTNLPSSEKIESKNQDYETLNNLLEENPKFFEDVEQEINTLNKSYYAKFSHKDNKEQQEKLSGYINFLVEKKADQQIENLAEIRGSVDNIVQDFINENPDITNKENTKLTQKPNPSKGQLAAPNKYTSSIARF